MLLRLNVENFLSIKDSEEISFVATRRKEEIEPLSVGFGGDVPGVLTKAILYGPNASGKSNFVNALRFVCRAILFSHSRGNPEGGVPRNPFELDEKCKKKQSSFQVDFVVEGQRYSYGFSTDGKEFNEEFLDGFSGSRRRKIYERTGTDVTFGPSMKGQKKLLVDLMRSNSLFLSTATQNDHEELSKIARFFRNIEFVSSISIAEQEISSSFRGKEFDKRILQFLTDAGTGVCDFRSQEKVLDDKTRLFVQEFLEAAKKHFPEINESTAEGEKTNQDINTNFEIELGHNSIDGKPVFLPLWSESSGTRRLLYLISKCLVALDTGNLIVVDELDASLHTLAVEAIISLFADSETNPKGAQLLATTHDTNLLSSELLRRDEIWLCEKDREGSSHYYSLAEIKSRSSENFEAGYLQGCYGAIPFSGRIY